MILIENKKAKTDYQIFKKFVAGIVLKGFEVKALKSKKGSLEGSYLVFKNQELFLKGAQIPPYQPQNVPFHYSPFRERKLLLKKKELIYLLTQKKSKKFLLIPLAFKTKNHLIKLEFALAKPLKKYQKKEKIKEREIKKKLKVLKIKPPL